MKVTSVEPGGTFQHQGKWAYYYNRNGQAVKVLDDLKKCAGEAKQAMRETVAWQRKRHGLK